MANDSSLPVGHSLVGPYGEGPVRITATEEAEGGGVRVRAETPDGEEVVLDLAGDQLDRLETVAPYEVYSVEFTIAFSVVLQFERERLNGARDIRGKPMPYHLESSVPGTKRVRRIVVRARPTDRQGLELHGEGRARLEPSVGGLLALQPVGGAPPWEPPRMLSIAGLLDATQQTPSIDETTVGELTVSERAGYDILGERLGYADPRAAEREIVEACGGRATRDGTPNSEAGQRWLAFARRTANLSPAAPRNGPAWEAVRDGFLSLYTSEVPESVRRAEGNEVWESQFRDDRERHARLVRRVHRNIQYADAPPVLTSYE